MTATATSAAERTHDRPESSHILPPRRIVVLGGGFGGVLATREFERLIRARSDIEITLVSRENFFVLTPLLFEACSGTLELRHCAQPIRPLLRSSRFIEATVRAVDPDRRVVHASTPDGREYALEYDHLVVALGATTNEALIPGSELAFTFKTVADALVLRNHIIECFERADAEADRERRQGLLRFVVVGGGLGGVELLGELTAFATSVLRYYPRVRADELRFDLIEASPRILPEMDTGLAAVATTPLERRGATLRASTPVLNIGIGRVTLEKETIEAETIVLAAGIAPNAVVREMPVERDSRGRIVVDATMRSVSHATAWALGDCAAIPGPDGRPYPALAQHATREAKHLARNIIATIEGQTPRAFVFRSVGTMASLGHTDAVARVKGLQLTGFVAWWLRRTYYLLQMPRWDRRLRIMLDWTVALFFRPDISKVGLAVERDERRRDIEVAPPASPPHPLSAAS